MSSVSEDFKSLETLLADVAAGKFRPDASAGINCLLQSLGEGIERMEKALAVDLKDAAASPAGAEAAREKLEAIFHPPWSIQTTGPGDGWWEIRVGSHHPMWIKRTVEFEKWVTTLDENDVKSTVMFDEKPFPLRTFTSNGTIRLHERDVMLSSPDIRVIALNEERGAFVKALKAAVLPSGGWKSINEASGTTYYTEGTAMTASHEVIFDNELIRFARAMRMIQPKNCTIMVNVVPKATASAPKATASAPKATASAPKATASAPKATACDMYVARVLYYIEGHVHQYPGLPVKSKLKAYQEAPYLLMSLGIVYGPNEKAATSLGAKCPKAITQRLKEARTEAVAKAAIEEYLETHTNPFWKSRWDWEVIKK
jgi:hypothetical protein